MLSIMTPKKFNKIILIILFLISCDEATTPAISNEILILSEQEMYLSGSYTDKYQIKLSWYDYYGCNSYDILLEDNNNTLYDGTTEIQTYHDISDLNYNPGYYFTADVSCSEDQGIEYSDLVIINTKEIDPIENIAVHVEAGGYDDSLSFTHSSDLDVGEWDFYNFQFDQNNPSTHPHYFDISNSGLLYNNSITSVSV